VRAVQSSQLSRGAAAFNTSLVLHISTGSGVAHELTMASAVGGRQRSVSGVAVAQECPDTFHVLKTRSAHRFITFKIDADAGQVQVDEAGPPDASYGMFEDALPEGDCRFAGACGCSCAVHVPLPQASLLISSSSLN